MTAPAIPYADLLGLPFAYGGRGPAAFDCYGLAAELVRRSGRALPVYDSSPDSGVQHACFDEGLQQLDKVESPRPGDVVMFVVRPPWVSHIGVVVDSYGSFVHIMERCSVARERLDSPTWRQRLAGIWRPRC